MGIDQAVRGSTVRGLQMRAMSLAALIGAFAIVGTIAGLISRNATEAAQANTAPSLVVVQDLLASVAESSTAATGAFLSSVGTGAEDRVQRNLYEDALRRASDQTEQVASLVGDNETSHQALRDIAAALIRYSGEIESARLAAQLGDASAELRLRNTLVQTQAVVDASVRTVTAELQRQLDERSAEGRTLTLVAVGLGAVCVLGLVAVQWHLFQTTNRVLNLGLLAATALIFATSLILLRGTLVRQAAIDNALSGGFNSITTTAEIQRSAYAVQSEKNLTLLGTTASSISELETAVEVGIAQALEDADSPRELAAATELELRWNRYLQTSERDVNLQFSNFNGLNTSIESVLSDNRGQFNSGVASAASAVANAGAYVVVVSVLGLLAGLYGLQLRLREYS